jgi:hypothetical protein
MNRDEALEFVEKIRNFADEMQNTDLDEVIAAVLEDEEQELIDALRSIHDDSSTAYR